MDNTNNQGYQTLGKKVFWLFFLQTSPATIVMFFLFLTLLIISFQSFIADTAYGNMQQFLLNASLISFFFFLLILIISFVFSWLTYINYMFCIAEDSFKIKRGILNRTEDAIPYRQIQNVDIEQDFLFLMLGLSRVIILTAGREDEKEDADASEGVIPAVDKKLAEWLQTELLKRAEIQKTIQTNGTSRQN